MELWSFESREFSEFSGIVDGENYIQLLTEVFESRAQHQWMGNTYCFLKFYVLINKVLLMYLPE